MSYNKCDVCGHFMSYIDMKAVDSLVKYLNDMSMTMSMNANILMSVSQQLLTSSLFEIYAARHDPRRALSASFCEVHRSQEWPCVPRQPLCLKSCFVQYCNGK